MKTLDNDLLVDYFDFPLPESLIAQSPLQKRSDSKLLLIDRENGQLAHDTFNHLSRWLRSGDVLVVNNERIGKFEISIQSIKFSSSRILD